MDLHFGPSTKAGLTIHKMMQYAYRSRRQTKVIDQLFNAHQIALIIFEIDIYFGTNIIQILIFFVSFVEDVLKTIKADSECYSNCYSRFYVCLKILRVLYNYVEHFFQTQNFLQVFLKWLPIFRAFVNSILCRKSELLAYT